MGITAKEALIDILSFIMESSYSKQDAKPFLSSELKLEQMNLALAKMPAGIIFTVLSILLSIFLLFGKVPGLCLLFWGVFGITVVGSRLYLYLIFKPIKPDIEKTLIWEKHYFWTTAITGVLFGSTGFFFFSVEEPSLQLFILLLISWTTVRAIGTLCHSLFEFRVYVMLAAMPVIITLLFLGESENYLIVTLFTVFILVIVQTAKDVNSRIINSLSLDCINREFVRSSSNTNEKTISGNKQLQTRIDVQREVKLHEQQQALLRITRFDADHQGDIEAIVFHMLETASEVLKIPNAVLWRIGNDGKFMEAVSVFPGNIISKASLKIFRSHFPGFFESVEMNSLLIADDLTDNCSIIKLADHFFVRLNICSAIGASLRFGGVPIGVVLFFQQNEIRKWFVEEQIFVSTLAEMIAHAIGQHHKMEIESALLESQKRAQVTLESIGDGVVSTDMNGVVDYLNPVAERQTGWSLKEACGKHVDLVLKLFNETTGSLIHNVLDSFMELGANRFLSSGVIMFDRAGLREYSVEIIVSPIRLHNRVEIGRVIVFHDMTDLRVMTRKISYQATHDTLTGLVNRREFENQLGLALYSARVEKKNHVLLYLDLDQFKVVNDTCGHLAGDELLKQVSTRLHNILREDDSLARLGGDEFGILLRGCKIVDARIVAEKLCNELHDYRFGWQGRIFSVGVSIGLVPILAEIDDMAEIMSAADAACYRAKEEGRNRVHVYLPDDKYMAMWHGEMQWVHKINKALEENRLLLYYQPVKPVFEDKCPRWYCEFLIRMKDENNKIISPASFIPAAERYQLMTLLDRWVFETLVKAYENGNPVLARYDICALNISGHSLCDESFLEFVLSTFKTHLVNPEKFCFEITETAAVSNLTKASMFIDKVTEIGCSLALDDFGSGLSSFGYLKALNVDFLKIDGSFVKDMVEDPIDRAMVESVNQIGHVMNKKTIAEFVENDEIMEQLRQLGVDYAQGYAIEKPKPL